MDKKLKRGLRVFIIITIFTVVILLSITIKRETFWYLKKMKPGYLLLSLLLWLFYVFCDAFKVSILTKGVSGKDLPIPKAFDVILGGHFLAAITPFQTGGFPLQIYLIMKEGVGMGKSALVILLRSFLFGLFLVLFFPFLLPLVISEFKEGKIILDYAIFAYILILVFLFLLLFKPWILKRLLMKIPSGNKKMTERLFYEIDELRKGLFRFARYKLGIFAFAFFINLLGYLSYFSIAPVILYGLNISSPIFTVFIAQIFIVAVTFFFPTPGASGAAEGVFFGIFSSFCPFSLLGVYTILWRFFTFYTGAIAGGILMAKRVGIYEED